MPERRGLRYSLTFRTVRQPGDDCRCRFPRCCDARSVRAASVGRHGQQGPAAAEALERAHVLEPAASLLGISSQADAVKELLPPAALRGAMRGGRGAELDRARRWLMATAAEAGATVAVLGSSYGGLPGWDLRSLGHPPCSATSRAQQAGWLGCTALRQYAEQLCACEPARGGGRGLLLASAGAGRLPFRTRSCDAVIASGVLDQLSTQARRERCVSEILRVLSVDAEALLVVLASEPNALSHEWGADLLVPAEAASAPVYFHVFAEGELEALVNSVADRSGICVEVVWAEHVALLLRKRTCG